MLILAFGFRAAARPKPPNAALSSLSFTHGARPPCAIPDFAAPPVRPLQGVAAGAMSRSLALQGMKPIYCTSIRQRERKCCCQIIVRELCFRSQPSTLRMLTYHLGLLSNPCQPQAFTSRARTTVRRMWLQRYVFLPTPPNFSLLFLSALPLPQPATGATCRHRRACAQLYHCFFRHLGK